MRTIWACNEMGIQLPFPFQFPGRICGSQLSGFGHCNINRRSDDNGFGHCLASAIPREFGKRGRPEYSTLMMAIWYGSLLQTPSSPPMELDDLRIRLAGFAWIQQFLPNLGEEQKRKRAGDTEDEIFQFFWKRCKLSSLHHKCGRRNPPPVPNDDIPDDEDPDFPNLFEEV